MNRFFVVLLGLAAFVSGYQAMAGEQKAAAAVEAKKEHPFAMIDADGLKKLQAEAPSLVIVDSRGGKYFDGKVIKGAVQIAADATTAESLAAVAPDKATPIVFYCTNTSCHASELAAYKANELGYTSIYKYSGGIEDWVAKGFEVAQLEATVAEEKVAN